MTMPPSVKRDPVKRRDWMLRFGGLPDGQKTLGDNGESETPPQREAQE